MLSSGHESWYWWKGKVDRGAEALLFIKTDLLPLAVLMRDYDV